MSSDAILTLKDVVAGYGKMTILNGTTASIRRGAITTVIGPNGAGKSTMFKTIFGLLAVRTGKIEFAGRDTTNLTPRQMLDAGSIRRQQGHPVMHFVKAQHWSISDPVRDAGAKQAGPEDFVARRISAAQGDVTEAGNAGGAWSDESGVGIARRNNQLDGIAAWIA